MTAARFCGFVCGMENNKELIEKFLSAYPGYTRKIRRPFVSPDEMERINAALARQRPSKEQWAEEFKRIKPVSMPENPTTMFAY